MDKVFQSVFYLFLIIILFKLSQFAYRVIRERRYMKELAQSGMPYIDKMDGYQFEIYLKALFQQLGYKPQVTQKSGDFGADLVMKGKDKIVIQAKRYGVKNRVSLSAVQEVYGAKAYYKANQAWVVTNSYFTKQAKELAAACDVTLVDRADLQKFINEINPVFKAREIFENITPEPRKCPKCGQDLVVRDGNGCSSFPSCRHTEKINKEVSKSRPSL
ncbi:restriction endonuclease [Priestia megaterium]|uniref:restriction endonuclease n=1 Tax=Priestia megaterium TaxID=1404 RepID=UPI003CFF83D6